jgi:transcriptional regulator with PAS, ATPase and Fis domain
MTLRLVVEVEGAIRRVFPMGEDEIRIGRGSENQLVLEDTLISRTHCRIYRQHAHFWIEDLGSANGVTVNGAKVDRVPLKPGDCVELGPFRIEVQPRLSPQSSEVPTERDLSPAGQASRSGQELSILLDILRSLQAQIPAAQQMDRILGSLMRAVDGERALLFRVEARAVEAVHAHWKEGADRELPVSHTLIRKVTAEREPCLITDLVDHPDRDLGSLMRIAAAQVRSILVTPVKRGQHVTGVLYVDSLAQRRAFTTAELDLLAKAGDHLAGLLQTIESQVQLSQENRRLRAEPSLEIPLHRLCSATSPMRAVLALMERAARKPVTVLLLGETGTGKEVLARALHGRSGRSGRFVAINCGGIPETLLEAELFGYEKGAFTGAAEERPGLLELADGGTLFLDEVGDMPLAIQVKVLRVLEERQATRLGSGTPRAIDFRLVGATHRNLDEAVHTGHFRQDLLYRLKVMVLELPALRDRLMDLPCLVEYFIETLSERAKTSAVRPAADFLDALGAHRWPGNLRELRNVLERALVMGEGSMLTRASLPVEIARAVRGTLALRPPEVLQPFANEYERFELNYLRRLYQVAGPNISAMARVSGWSRVTLYKKLGQIQDELDQLPAEDD